MSTESLILSILVSASLGALVGIERQWGDQQANPDHNSAVGLRTFTLWAILGTLSAYIAEKFSPLVYPISFGAFFLLLIFSHSFDSERRSNLGLTTISVGILVFLIGSLVYWQQKTFAAALTISILILLASKQKIHDWTRRLTSADIRSALQFAAITGVVLPVVPNQYYGPFEAFNPFSTWLMVVLVAGLGFLGYVTMRFLGSEAGIGITGLVGGLASSTATTLAFSRQSRQQPELSSNFALGIIVACTVMIARIAVMILVVSPEVFSKVWLPLLVISIPGIAISLRSLGSMRETGSEVKHPVVANPLGLKIAIKFALIYAVVVLFTKIGAHYYGSSGTLVVSFISGITDMDAIALTLTQLFNNTQITASLAAKGIILAAIANTLLKGAFVVFLGSEETRKKVLAAMGGTVLFGVAILWFV